MPFNMQNFATDYYIDVNSPEYVAIPAARKASEFDDNLLLMVETMRAMITTLDSEEKARLFRQVMSRMMAAVPDSPQTYTDKSVSVVGNISVNIAALSEPCGFTFSSEVTGSGNAPFVDSIYFDIGDLAAVETVDDLVTALNAQITVIGANAWVVAFRTIDSRVGFRLTPAGESALATFSLTTFPSDDIAGGLLDMLGIPPGTYCSKAEVAANAARDAGIAAFVKSSNPLFPA